MRGDATNADKFKQLAKVDAEHWVKVAGAGDHYLLAFDRPNTWSQKYNLVWDKILGLDIFPPMVAQQEVAFYKSKLQPFGVPLDSRTHLTKTDWSLWSASMATDKADFEAMISPIYDYLNQTTSRDPIADSYQTDRVRSRGMHARPVVGGLFIKMLTDREMWDKWAHRDHGNPANWAALPKPPQVTEVIATSRETPAIWHYTTEKPSEGWTKPDFDDSSWKQGPGGFGTRGTPGAVIGTTWNTGNIWLRREVEIPAGKFNNLQFLTYHDEDVEIYVNGFLASSESGFNGSYLPLEISNEAKQLLKPGAKVMLAVHCHQTEGGQDIDVGLANVTSVEPE
jgi:hypothetical protein